MPIISVVLAEGRSTAKKRAFIRSVTEAAVQSLGVKPEQVRVIINETPLGHFAVAGVTFAEAAEQKTPNSEQETPE